MWVLLTASIRVWQRDLDNYLFPIARELSSRYVSVWGTKARASDSFVTVGHAVLAAPPDWPAHTVPRTSGGESSWNQAVRDAVNGADQLPPGPVGTQIALTVGPDRNWTNTWKRTIDGLEPLLGRTYADRDWNPQDGRIVRLGMHLSSDRAWGHDVAATIWARTGDLDWPELDWFKRMTDAERASFMEAHKAVLNKVAGSKPRQTAHAPQTPEQPQRIARRGRPPTALPPGVVDLAAEEDLESAIADGAFIIKTDTAGPPKLHLKPLQCSGVSRDNFRQKVILGGGKNGRYYRAVDPAPARQRWPRLEVCATCRRLDPTGAATIDAAHN